MHHVEGTTVKRVTITSAARQTADLIAEHILAYEGDEPEWLLGSEDELMSQLGVGRPTIRQAARLLEQQQLLEVRRGINGGLFGRRPSSEGVSANARVFLKSEHTTFRQLLQAELVLGPACATLAAANPNEEERHSLLHFWEESAAEGAASARRFMELAPEFQRRVAQLSGSPALFLFVGVLMDLATPSVGIAEVYADTDRRKLTIDKHGRIAEAIAEGNGQRAASRMRQHLESIMAWADDRSLDEHMGTS
jgi:GntR family transcriptional repressor for pyruvate dehydrogenase complex